MRSNLVAVAVAAFVVTLFAVAPRGARADVPPEDSQGCRGKAAGVECKRDNGDIGHCEDAECSRARPTGDSSYACTLCMPGAPVAPPEAPKKSACAGGSLELGPLALLALVAGRRLLRVVG